MPTGNLNPHWLHKWFFVTSETRFQHTHPTHLRWTLSAPPRFPRLSLTKAAATHFPTPLRSRAPFASSQRGECSFSSCYTRQAPFWALGHEGRQNALSLPCLCLPGKLQAPGRVCRMRFSPRSWDRDLQPRSAACSALPPGLRGPGGRDTSPHSAPTSRRCAVSVYRQRQTSGCVSDPDPELSATIHAESKWL